MRMTTKRWIIIIIWATIISFFNDGGYDEYKERCKKRRERRFSKTQTKIDKVLDTMSNIIWWIFGIALKRAIFVVIAYVVLLIVHMF
jgi:hypothetical protein